MLDFLNQNFFFRSSSCLWQVSMPVIPKRRRCLRLSSQNPMNLKTLQSPSICSLTTVSPKNKILQLQTDVQHCLDTLIPEQKFVVKVRKNLDLPEYCWYPPRSRYRADSILLFQHRMDGKNYTMGVLSEDISVDAHGYEDWGVQGLGSMPGKNAVVSTSGLFTPEPESFLRINYTAASTPIALSFE